MKQHPEAILGIIKEAQNGGDTYDELESMEADEENYLGRVINILKIKKSLLKLYQHLSEKLDPTGLVISYENVLTKN